MAYGSTIGTSLFRNIHAASPYLPMQYQYKDWIPSQAYYAFATHAGCPPNLAYGATDNPQTIFHCLQSQSAETLQNASSLVSSSGVYGTWAFLPVTDNVFVQELPSQQYLEKRVNGLHALIGVSNSPDPALVRLLTHCPEQCQRRPSLHPSKHHHRRCSPFLAPAKLPPLLQLRHLQDSALLPLHQRLR